MVFNKTENRIALVTGASRLNGIGAAICQRLAADGIDIFFTYWSKYDSQQPWGVNPHEPEILKKEIEKQNVRCFKKEIDLVNPENITELLSTVIDKMGTPSILINNAAYSTNASYKDIDSDLLDQHYNINLRLTTLLSSHFARLYDKKEGGRIISLTSGQFKGPMNNELAYAATKGGIDALTITLAAELKEKGITVNAVNPGPTDTGWMDEDTKKTLSKKFLNCQINQPEDIARVISFLVSKEADRITGEVIHIGGGFYS